MSVRELKLENFPGNLIFSLKHTLNLPDDDFNGWTQDELLHWLIQPKFNQPCFFRPSSFDENEISEKELGHLFFNVRFLEQVVLLKSKYVLISQIV